ncbi:S-adenosyl-L-methionine-dependent methyltransferase [Mucor mucedo]|uniref:S-adenosyl-L-methionine-dependent methyltransferase n=1 Tax=Mucor mucedo TaxID=29922 RepID=UPI00221F5237|nr:S-adenosyl-L-methionine-dependent methyltransferase [Mucor mucedo]KAI7896581.1 S-adenosyl-L-methionine-dependent methyltransferase [Mucor mucedo]
MGINQSRHKSKPIARKESVHSDQSVQHSTSSVNIEGRYYLVSDTGSYCLPSDEVEQDRLNSQHFSLKALLGGNVLPSIETMTPRKASVLDVGCGSGCWVMEMAIDHPEYQITGIDIADMFPTTIRPENVTFLLHNVVKGGLPYPDNSFDFVHLRLMIVAFRSGEWSTILTEIFRVLKPGGLLSVVETDFTEKTTDPVVELFNSELIKAMQANEQDPFIGAKLNTLLQELQYDIIEVKELFLSYELPLNPIAKEMLINWKSAILSLKPMLAHRVTTDPAQYSSAVDRYMNGITNVGWRVKVWAYCAQKPL